MAERWRLADGMTLTHLENGALLDEALHSTEPTPISPIIESAIESGIIIDSDSTSNAQESSL